MSNNKYNHFATIIGFVSKKQGADSAVTIKEFGDRQYASFTLKALYGADGDIAVYYGVSIPASQASLIDNLAPGSRVAVSGSLSMSAKKDGEGYWYNLDGATFLGEIHKVEQGGRPSKPAKSAKPTKKGNGKPVEDEDDDSDADRWSDSGGSADDQGF